MDGAQAFHAARDVLLRHGTDLDAARAAFRWPALDRFNWALDHFDRMARGNEAPALRFIGPGDADHLVSFAEMARRSNQVANHLRSLGVRRGDRVLLLLTLFLIAIGLLAVAAASPASARRYSGEAVQIAPLYYFWRQLMWVGVSLPVLVATSMLPVRVSKSRVR